MALQIVMAALWAVSGAAWLQVLSFFVTALGLPVFLGVLGVRRLNSGARWLVTAPVLAIGLLVAVLGHYLSWVAAERDQRHLDGEGVALLWGEMFLGAVIVLGLIGVAAVRKALFRPLV